MRPAQVLALLLVLPAAGAAQQAPPTLSLDDAIAMAREHNPDYRARLNDGGVAQWGVREAYASLLPSATIGGGVSYQGPGQARIGGYTTGDIGLGETPAYYYSSYSLRLDLGLDGSSFYRIGQRRAERQATLASMDAASVTLEAEVTRQYLAALRMRDAVDLARAELERAEANLALAEARRDVAAATAIEAKQAEVERGRAQVELLRSEAGFETERLRLLQLVGLDAEGPVELTTEVRVFEPEWDLAWLTELAYRGQPELEAARATVASARSGVGMARSAYWPRLSLSAGLSGYTRRVGSDRFLLDQAEEQLIGLREQCAFTNDILGRLNPPLPPQDCSQFVLTDEMRADVLSPNRQFPFDFDREPVSVTFGISLPVFQGLSRQRQLETANAQAEDARLRLRALELQVRTDVQAAHRNLEAAHRAVQLEERNSELADDQLRLARERYRVGAGSFIELMEAEALKANADRSYLLGVYAFQEALAALRAAVGQGLPVPENTQGQ